MRLHHRFERWKGAGPPSGAVLVGAETAATLASARPNPSTDFIATMVYRDSTGWPVHRVLFAYKGPATSAVLVTAYVWDSNTESWFRIGTAVTVTTGIMALFDFPGLANLVPNKATLDSGASSGSSTEMAFIVTDPGGAMLDGNHVFVTAPDVTTTEGLDATVLGAVTVVGGATEATLATRATEATLASLNAKGAAATAVTSTALAASKILLAGPGTLKAAAGVLDATAGTGTYYVQMLDSGTLPADGVVTHLLTPIVINHVNGLPDEFGFDDRIPPQGIAAAAGAVMVLSTTLANKTIGGAFLLAAGAV